ncbi:MAG: ABC transporter ATP-binding protein, partial [Candidatus Thiodiazotropha endolucinida]|nr:ABC transporter ATP-binding protein [Candidatus Thiodiazotropha taylori]MCW4321549.1 ABC transporter ATP-binding protein [Candidatus Thiodiazotropha taylori]
MPMIQVNHVWKQYDDNIVLERLNKTVDEGEFVTLVG